MADVLCIYHGNCADGFSAAWVVRQYYHGEYGIVKRIQAVEFHPGVYQEPPPDVKGKSVILVDFSYKRPVIEKMLEDCTQMLIIDHHKTAIEDLTGIEHPKLRCVFDVEHSGAMLTWQYYFPESEPPRALLHVEDRDLWRFRFEDTRAIQAAIFSFEYTFENWDFIMRNEALSRLRTEGEAIERKHFKDVRELIPVTMRWFNIGGFDVPICNLPYTLTSDVGHQLCELGVPFAGCYWDTAEGRVFSLRSVGDFDVAAIAKQYGGGGHKNASGFRVSREHPLARQ